MAALMGTKPRADLRPLPTHLGGSGHSRHPEGAKGQPSAHCHQDCLLVPIQAG